MDTETDAGLDHAMDRDDKDDDDDVDDEDDNEETEEDDDPVQGNKEGVVPVVGVKRKRASKRRRDPTTGWPNGRALELRLKNLLEKMTKKDNVEKRQAAHVAKNKNKESRKRERKTKVSQQWSKREKQSMQRGLQLYGCGPRWDLLRTYSSLTNKTNEQVKEYADKLLAQARMMLEIAGKDEVEVASVATTTLLPAAKLESESKSSEGEVNEKIKEEIKKEIEIAVEVGEDVVMKTVDKEDAVMERIDKAGDKTDNAEKADKAATKKKKKEAARKA
jgi:hypothetical protein